MTPFLACGPLVLATMSWALGGGTSPPLAAAACFPLGLLAWLLMEYVIHRWLCRIHEIAHGYHHRFPDDPAW